MYNSSTIYHIYNQTNNHQKLFHCADNYRYFLRKVRRHLTGNADILCYCLMPDHFHLMLKPTERGCQLSRSKRYQTAEEKVLKEFSYQQNLSHAFKTMLSSYSQAMNKRFGGRGSLIKSQTKAKPGYVSFCDDAALLAGDQPFTLYIPYLKTCFNYIHYNPVKAKLVNHPTEWEFSSALDYTGLRDSHLINFEVAEKLLGIARSPNLGQTR